jgi:hypothetical protein
MQIARTGYLITDRLITQTRRPKLGLDGEISFHREWSQRHDLRRVGLSRERHPRRVRSFILNGGNLARPKRFELLTPRFVVWKSRSAGHRATVRSQRANRFSALGAAQRWGLHQRKLPRPP